MQRQIYVIAWMTASLNRHSNEQITGSSYALWTKWRTHRDKPVLIFPMKCPKTVWDLFQWNFTSLGNTNHVKNYWFHFDSSEILGYKFKKHLDMSRHGCGDARQYFMKVKFNVLTLTYLPLVSHICVIESSQYCFRKRLVAYSAPSHYLNQCWLIVNWISRNIFQIIFNQNSIILIQGIENENVVCQNWQPFCPGGDELIRCRKFNPPHTLPHFNTFIRIERFNISA